jgi:hypothetical protein
MSKAIASTTICAACDKPLSRRYVEQFLAPLPATPENIAKAGVTCSSCTEWIAEQERLEAEADEEAWAYEADDNAPVTWGWRPR